MKLKFVVTHIIRQTEIPALLDSSGYKHALCQNAVSTTKLKMKFRKTVTRLSVGLSVTFFFVSCKTVYWWVTKNCCFMGDLLFVMLLLHVSAPTGNPEGGHLQRNTFTTTAIKYVHIWS